MFSSPRNGNIQKNTLSARLFSKNSVKKYIHQSPRIYYSHNYVEKFFSEGMRLEINFVQENHQPILYFDIEEDRKNH